MSKTAFIGLIKYLYNPFLQLSLFFANKQYGVMSGAFIRTSVFQFIGYFRICLVCLNTLSEISTFLEKKMR